MFLKMHAFTVRTKLMRRIPPIDEHCYYVDMEYVLFPIPQVRTVTFLAEVVYLYRIGLPGQSMNMSRMQKNEINYDRVFNRLLAFYREQQEKRIPEYLLAYLETCLRQDDGDEDENLFELSVPMGNTDKDAEVR